MTLDFVLIFPMLEDKLSFSDKLTRYWANLAAWGAQESTCLHLPFLAPRFQALNCHA